MSGASLLIASAALVGFQLAEDKSLSTMPLAVHFIAVMLTSIPAAVLMNRVGRKRGFLFASLFALGGAMTASWSILQHNFIGFTLGVALIGVFNGFANYLRFAAADAVSDELKSRAISFVLAGGVIAAVIGPNLANHTRERFFDVPFAGSYISLLLIYFLATAAFALLKLPNFKDEVMSETRRLREIMIQPRWMVAVVCGMLGYGVMTFVMTATPLAMQHHAHNFPDTSFVIQWHVLAMFAPSFVTGHIINKFGELRVMFVGGLLGIACVLTNLNGTSLIHFWLALVLLGISWNFLFVGATSLLTTTYVPAERYKVQAVNDFIIFSTVALASLSAGYLQHHFGWRSINVGVLPLLATILLSILLLAYQQQRRIKVAV